MPPNTLMVPVGLEIGNHVIVFAGQHAHGQVVCVCGVRFKMIYCVVVLGLYVTPKTQLNLTMSLEWEVIKSYHVV